MHQTIHKFFLCGLRDFLNQFYKQYSGKTVFIKKEVSFFFTRIARQIGLEFRVKYI